MTSQQELDEDLNRDHAAELKQAASRLEGTVRHTVPVPSKVLSDLIGEEVIIKPENLQVTGSFKIRGAYNKIASLSDEDVAKGIVTASAGNHAQGVAYAARERKAKATIVMPKITPPLKVDATKAYGADVVLEGEVFDESSAYAQKLADEQGMTLVHPFNDYEVLVGQGTIGLEILKDVPNVTDVVVPLGGGGLGAGIALAIKTFAPNVRVIGATPEGSPAWRDSLAAGHVVPADAVHTSAEGVAVKVPGDLTFALLDKYLDDLVQVSEQEISEMILTMLEKHKLVVEAAGAVSLAALEQLRAKSEVFRSAEGSHVIVPVVSGGNIDTVTIGAVIQRGMISRGRIMQFSVELPDTPGQLVRVAQLLAEARANVIELNHDQFKASSHYTNAVLLEVTVETNGPDHIAQILDSLRRAGYSPKQIY
ncbi:MAG: threonine ammonia-lyase [Bifidobacteriaceae bacterium]|jgi:threonine dehydratase|nr:threonine ammonia-lyase [Bifidobacteriaceae bacterium]